MTTHTLGCPRCGVPLTQHRVGGISADICENCGGPWLDAGELAQIRRQAAPASGDATNVRNLVLANRANRIRLDGHDRTDVALRHRIDRRDSTQLRLDHACDIETQVLAPALGVNLHARRHSIRDAGGQRN